jgi:hypothetical protein
MRQGLNAKRSRGRSNNNNNNNNGRKQNVPLRLQTLDSSGPNGKLRGNAYQLHEKYLALARDAHSVGDRVAAENFFQHAEHYFRIINGNGPAPRPEYDSYEQMDGEQPDIPHAPPAAQPAANPAPATPATGNGPVDGSDQQPY